MAVFSRFLKSERFTWTAANGLPSPRPPPALPLILAQLFS